MVKFILEYSDDTLSTHSGLGLIGLLLSKTNISKRLSNLRIPEIKSLPSISNSCLWQNKSTEFCREFVQNLMHKKRLASS